VRLVRRRSLTLTALAAAIAVVAGISVATIVASPSGASTKARESLAEALRSAVDARDFKNVLDTTPPVLGAAAKPATSRQRDKYDSTTMPVRNVASTATAPLIHQTPNMDAAVIEVDDQGRPTGIADVLLSPQYPHGVTVPVSKDGLSTDQVRYRWWDDDEWDQNGGQGTRDVLAGRENAPLDFSSPFPGSVLKLMVGFEVLRLVDQGRVSLDAEYHYLPVTINPACSGENTETVEQFFDEMITLSKNESACAMIKMLHDLNAVDELNQTFVDLGLPTLMLTGTNAGNGGHWIGANMSSIDTAKLLLLLNGGPGRLWTAPNGTAVTRDALSTASRRFFLKELGEQGHNEALSTTNWCGRTYPAPGIPQLTAQRWIDPVNGTMNVGGLEYGQDVRPCNTTAEVTYAHKNGWVDTTGSDAGIVHSLPGKPKRNYIVAVFCNLGTDYIDVNRPADPPGIYPVPYTQKYGQLGLAIDKIMKSRRS
jgi:hypothetical protein